MSKILLVKVQYYGEDILQHWKVVTFFREGNVDFESETLGRLSKPSRLKIKASISPEKRQIQIVE